MATEKLKIKIKLYATYWNKCPTAEIKIDGISYFKKEIEAPNETVTEFIEFEHEFEEGKEYKLIIDTQNKDKNQTVLDEDASRQYLIALTQTYFSSIRNLKQRRNND